MILQRDESLLSALVSQSMSHIRQPSDAPVITGSASGIESGIIAVNAAAIPTVMCAFAIIDAYLCSGRDRSREHRHREYRQYNGDVCHRVSDLY